MKYCKVVILFIMFSFAVCYGLLKRNEAELETETYNGHHNKVWQKEGFY